MEEQKVGQTLAFIITDLVHLKEEIVAGAWTSGSSNVKTKLIQAGNSPIIGVPLASHDFLQFFCLGAGAGKSFEVLVLSVSIMTPKWFTEPCLSATLREVK